MNREIKFRAWDKVDERFVDWGRILLSSDMTGGGMSFFFNNPRIILMQFTGLKDKNGKEIYEGDIIDIGFRKRTVVTFQDGCFRAKYGVSNYRLAGWKSVEVIGNIYSNHELLKPTNG